MSSSAMIARKAWLDSRMQFVAALLIVICSSVAIVALYPEVSAALPAVRETPLPDGVLGDALRRSLEMQGTFRGYLWSEWNGGNFSTFGTLLPVLLGVSGAITARSGAFYTLALPVSRRSAILARVAVGLAETAILVLASFLVIALGALAIGESVSVSDVLAYAFCAFLGAAVFFSIALFLSTLFTGFWLAFMSAIGISLAFGVQALIFERLRYPDGGDRLPSFHTTMSGRTWFEDHSLPWGGLLLCAAASALLIYAAIRTFERRDF